MIMTPAALAVNRAVRPFLTREKKFELVIDQRVAATAKLKAPTLGDNGRTAQGKEVDAAFMEVEHLLVAAMPGALHAGEFSHDVLLPTDLGCIIYGCVECKTGEWDYKHRRYFPGQAYDFRLWFKRPPGCREELQRRASYHGIDALVGTKIILTLAAIDDRRGDPCSIEEMIREIDRREELASQQGIITNRKTDHGKEN